MTRGAAALALAAASACFTDYEVGEPARGGTSSGESGALEGVTDTGEGSADEGSGGGSGDGTSGGACEPASPGAGSCPARCTGGCALGTCTIACAPRSACEGIDIVCPQGWPCVVLCDGDGACHQVTVHCSDGPCELQCNGSGSCDGSVLECGAQACNAWCSDEGADLDEIECGPSCDCQANCTGTEGSEGDGGPGGSGEGGSSS